MKKTVLQSTIKRTLLIVLFGVVFLLSGCATANAANESAPASAETSAQNLCIEVTIGNVSDYTAIPLELPGENCTEIVYQGITDAAISIDGISRKLEDAIAENHISISQIIAAARMDAANGFCKEIAKSHNSLTKFVYQYPEYDLVYIHDVYETPISQHLISEFSVCARGVQHFPADYRNTYWNEKSGKPIDYEHWGLSFSVTEANSTGITIACVQSKGQQIGNLVADFFSVAKRDVDDSGNSFDISIEKISSETTPSLFINMNDSTEISIDLSSMYGELPSGNYALYFLIRDDYSEDMVHPLMRNYYDQQFFGIPFTIE